jgi:hypothetical protein
MTKQISFSKHENKVLPGFRQKLNNVLEKEGFKAVWDNSDIQRILTNLAETSVNRYRHLETNPAKTKSKIKQSQKQNQR